MMNEELVSRIKAGIDVSDNMLQLWQQNQGIINQVAARYRAYGEYEDLQQEGYIGLCSAVETYDQERGVQFLTYAVFWIKQQIQRYIDNCSSCFRIPAGMQQKIRNLSKFEKEYKKYYGIPPTDREICLSLGFEKNQLSDIRRFAREGNLESLNRPMSDEDETDLEDTIASDYSVEDCCIKNEMHKQLQGTLWPMVDALEEEQANMIKMRYKESLTMKEVGERMGVSYNHVRKNCSKAMSQLRTPSVASRLKPFIFDELVYNKALKGNGSNRFSETWTSSTERIALKL